MSTPERPKVVIIGAGAAGVFTGFQLQKYAPDKFDITIFDKNDAVGGNARGHDGEWQGQKVHIDCGAQFFYETTEPTYCDMLRDEGFFDEAGLIVESAVGMSVWNATEKHIEFAVADNILGILEAVAKHPGDWVHFLEFTVAAIDKFFSDDWTETFGDWLEGIWLSGDTDAKTKFKNKIVRPLMYQFGLMPPGELDKLSALGVVYFFVGSLPWPEHKQPPQGQEPKTAPFHLYTSNIGLDGIQKRLLTKYGLTAQLNTTIASISPQAQGGGWIVTAQDGTQTLADELVFATNPHATMAMLPNDSAFAELRDLLSGMPYQSVDIHVQQSPSSPYVSPDKDDWTVANVAFVEDTNGNTSDYMLSIWFGPLKGKPGDDFWKSWGSPNLEPGNQPPPWVLQTHQEVVYIPDYVVRRDKLGSSEYQGVNSLWYAGGYIIDYDTQDSCLKSGRIIAERLLKQYGLPEPVIPPTKPPIDPQHPPRLLVDIEKVLRTLGFSHPVVDEFKQRPSLTGA